MRVWNRTSGSCNSVLECEAPVKALGVNQNPHHYSSPNENCVLVGLEDGSVRQFSLETMTLVQVIPAVQGLLGGAGCSCVALATTANFFWAGGSDGYARLWRLGLDSNNVPLANLKGTVCGEGDHSATSPLAGLGGASPSSISSIEIVKDVALISAGGSLSAFDSVSGEPIETGLEPPRAMELSPGAMDDWLSEVQQSTGKAEEECPLSPAQRIKKNQQKRESSLAESPGKPSDEEDEGTLICAIQEARVNYGDPAAVRS